MTEADRQVYIDAVKDNIASSLGFSATFLPHSKPLYGLPMWQGLAVPTSIQAPTRTNCKNCGAVIRANKCDYCETRYL